MNSNISQEPLQFSREVVIAQLSTRASLTHGLKFIIAGLVACMLVVTFALPHLRLSDDLWILAVVAPPILSILAIRNLQWSVLESHQLRCPHCRHLLATERRWWNSPRSFCKACGKLAILPVRILKQASAT